MGEPTDAQFAAGLIARADEIDSRLGPIPGRTADIIAKELRSAAQRLQSRGDISETEVKRAAAAIANARGGRRGAPAVSNILDVLQKIVGGKLYDEVMEDARAALEAVRKEG